MHDRNKMYKRRIKQWGLDKKNKDEEMRAVVRKTKERLDRGKRSEILVRGKAIGEKEVMRYWRRKRISIDEAITHRTASVTPEAVEIVTPVPSRVATPTSLAVPERIFTAIRDYFEGSFASGNWVYDNPEILCYTKKVQEISRDELRDFVNHSLTACELFSNHRYQEAGRILISVTSKFKRILLAEHPETLGHILGTVMSVRRVGRDEIGMAILRQFCALGEFVVGKEHPLRLICGWLASVDAFQFEEIIARSLQSVTDQFESFVGPMHFSTLMSRTYHLNNINRERDQNEEQLRNLLEQCELRLEPSNVRTHLLRYELASHYFNGGQHAEALRVGQDLIAHVQYGQTSTWVYSDYYALGLSIVANSQWNLGHMSLAEAALREAIALRVSKWGTRDSTAGYCLYVWKDGYWKWAGRAALLKYGRQEWVCWIQRKYSERLHSTLDMNRTRLRV